MQDLDRLFALFDRLHQPATWQAVFGPPSTEGERTIVPVSSLRYAFGLRVSEPPVSGDEQPAGGYSASEPIALVEVTPHSLTVRPVIRWNQVIAASLLTVAWIAYLWAWTAGRRRR
jgi:uncharacterized spore protein YtfJ